MKMILDDLLKLIKGRKKFVIKSDDRFFNDSTKDSRDDNKDYQDLLELLVFNKKGKYEVIEVESAYNILINMDIQIKEEKNLDEAIEYWSEDLNQIYYHADHPGSFEVDEGCEYVLRLK